MSMSAVTKFVRPTDELIKSIADDMRQADADEVWASHHHTPHQALMSSYNESHVSTIVTVNDEPCVMIGLVRRDVLSGIGVPWMLGANKSLKYKKEFFNNVPLVIGQMLNVCPMLYNYVHSKNTISMMWLKHIGFTIENPEPYGPDNELFHRFYMQRGA